jgi:hypothetical protein
MLSLKFKKTLSETMREKILAAAKKILEMPKLLFKTAEIVSRKSLKSKNLNLTLKIHKESVNLFKRGVL